MRPTRKPAAVLGKDLLPHRGVIEDELLDEFSSADKLARANKEVTRADATSDAFGDAGGLGCVGRPGVLSMSPAGTFGLWRRHIPFGWAD